MCSYINYLIVYLLRTIFLFVAARSDLANLFNHDRATDMCVCVENCVLLVLNSLDRSLRNGKIIYSFMTHLAFIVIQSCLVCCLPTHSHRNHQSCVRKFNYIVFNVLWASSDTHSKYRTHLSRTDEGRCAKGESDMVDKNNSIFHPTAWR